MKQQKLTNEAASGLFLEMSMLLHAGVSASDSLHLLAEEEKEKYLEEMATKLEDGMPLAKVFTESGAFQNYVCGLLEMGERAGRLEETFLALARYYEKQTLLDRRLKSALLYPSMLLLVMLVVIVVLLVKVLPVFNDVYASMGGQLTGVAGGLLAIGQGLGAIMPVLLIVLGIVVIFLVMFSASTSFRDRAMAAFRKIAGDRGVSRMLNTARFAQSLSMGMSSGLHIEEALGLSSKLIDEFPAAKARCQSCLDKLENGVPFAKALAEADVLPLPQCRLLDLGLKGGSGDTAMEEIANKLSDDGDRALEDKISKVEPALVVTTSMLVGLILLSVMLPLMNIMTAIG